MHICVEDDDAGGTSARDRGNTRSITSLIQWWVDRYNAGTGWVEAVTGENFEWIEHPSASYPDGRRGDRGFMATAAIRNLEKMPDRKIEVVRIASLSATEGVIEYVHMGTAVNGDRIRFVGVSFLTFDDDHLARQVDYVVRLRHDARTGAVQGY